MGCSTPSIGSTTDSQSCIVVNCPVDCITMWSAWSSCSSSCGIGLFLIIRCKCFHNFYLLGIRTRNQIVTQAPLYGGVACPTVNIDQSSCILALCPDCSNPANGPNGQGCFNNGQCVDIVKYDGAFTCNCTSGFIGDNCDSRLIIGKFEILNETLTTLSDLGDCQLPILGPGGNPCDNFGTCVDYIPEDGSFTCDCSGTLFTGQNCDKSNFLVKIYLPFSFMNPI